MYPGAIAEKHPDKAAIIMAGSGQTISYRELDEASNRGAHVFRRLGLVPGDAIAIFMDNHPCFLEICWAAQRSGLRYTAISSRLTPAEAEYIATDCEAKLLIASRSLAEVAVKLAPALGHLRGLLAVGGAIDGYASWEEACAAEPATPIADEVEGADMLYSSGTTGRPKGVAVPMTLQPLGSPAPFLALLAGLYGANEDSVYLSPAPLYHAAPLRFTMGMLRLGASCVIMEKFDALAALQLIETHRVTHSQWVPTMFVRMLKLPEEERARFDVSSLRVAIHAAAPCPIPVKEQMIEWWGPVLHEYYAGTEGNGFNAIDSAEWLAHRGSVGRCLTARIHILDDDGNELAPGETGTIYFEGGGRFAYHNDAEKTQQATSRQGWTTLGDVGHLDADDYLYLTDRKAHMIISGGVNIYPQETENVLILHPAVADVAVIGVPNEDFGEEVKAVVQPIDMAQAGPDLERELIDFCASRISKVKCPRSVDFDAELPRHPTGKLYKRLLKDRYWAEHESRLV